MTENSDVVIRTADKPTLDELCVRGRICSDVVRLSFF